VPRLTTSIAENAPKRPDGKEVLSMPKKTKKEERKDMVKKDKREKRDL
jgi:hypothetical protein